MAQILIVEDEEKIRVLLDIILTSAGHQTFQAENGRSALAALESEAVDLVVSDVCMDEMDGFDLLATIRERQLGCPVIFITAFATLESAVEALRLGAADYLTKPFEEADVILAVERALGRRRLLSENLMLRQEVDEKSKGVDGIFISPAMQKVQRLALKVAKSDATVLLSGESGTGKEVMARFIHYESPRHEERFVAMNCAAIAPNLLEAELFGHERGAFTGADKARAGKFEFAGGGTLFLDEIGELPLDAQVKLLRAIQEKSVQRVGGNQEIETKCRLICASNRDLTELVRRGDFREDLYYRLAVFPIALPPLRERQEDIVPLVEHCIEKRNNCALSDEALTPAAAKLLQNYAWPGNVRELFNVVERAIIMKEGEAPFTSDDFPHLGGQNTARAPVEEIFKLPAGGIDYEDLQRSVVKQALELANGNQSAAARLLNISRAKLRTMVGLISGDIKVSNLTVEVQDKKK